MDSKNSNKSFSIVLTIIIVLLIGIITAGIIIFNMSGKKVIEEEENGADIILNYSSNDSGLQIRNAKPKKDTDGIVNGEYFDFSIETLLDNAEKIEYEISVVKDEINSTISDDDIIIYLEKEKEGTYTMVFGPEKFTPIKKQSKFGSKKGSMPLIEVKKTNSTTDNYRLKMWLSEKSTTNGTYTVEVEVNAIAK